MVTGSPLDYFEAIYCINLKKSTERRKKFEDQIIKLWIHNKVVFFEAIENKLNWHIGCMSSNREIIKVAKEQNYGNILVFEDDAEVIYDNLIYLSRALEELSQKKWGLFYLWCSFVWEDLPRLERNNNIYRICGWRGTHAIAYNKSIYSKFLQITDWSSWVKLIKKYIGFDVYLSLFLQEFCRSYIPLKPIFKQNSGFSYIKNKIANSDKLIIDNFNTVSEWWIFTRIFIKIVRKIIVYTWLLSNKKINIFRILSYYNARCGKSTGKWLRKCGVTNIQNKWQ